MEAHNPLPVLERALKPDCGRPERCDVEESPRKLNLSVIFTSIEATLSALKKAAALSRGLHAHITLLVAQVVPYPLPLETPPVLIDWNERRFHVIAHEIPVETVVRIYLCRDRLAALRSVLQEGSTVIVGCRNGWWPSADKRLARKLQRCGYQVLVEVQ